MSDIDIERLKREVNMANVKVEISDNNSVLEMEKSNSHIFEIQAEENKKGKNSKYSILIQLNVNNFVLDENKSTMQIYKVNDSEGKSLKPSVIIVQVWMPNMVQKYSNKGSAGLTEEEIGILDLIGIDLEFMDTIYNAWHSI